MALGSTAHMHKRLPTHWPWWPSQHSSRLACPGMVMAAGPSSGTGQMAAHSARRQQPLQRPQRRQRRRQQQRLRPPAAQALKTTAASLRTLPPLPLSSSLTCPTRHRYRLQHKVSSCKLNSHQHITVTLWHMTDPVCLCISPCRHRRVLTAGYGPEPCMHAPVLRPLSIRQ